MDLEYITNRITNNMDTTETILILGSSFKRLGNAKHTIATALRKRDIRFSVKSQSMYIIDSGTRLIFKKHEDNLRGSAEDITIMI